MKTNQLIQAIVKENVEAVQTLLQEGADPNLSEDMDRVTPLHFVAQKTSTPALLIADALIVAGADPLAKTKPDGQTPIEIARLTSNVAMVSVLSRAIQTKPDVC